MTGFLEAGNPIHKGLTTYRESFVLYGCSQSFRQAATKSIAWVSIS